LAIAASSTAVDTVIACAQLAPVLGELDGNRARAAQAIAAAARSGARLVVLPELVNTGYALADDAQAREFGEPSDGPTISGWQALCEAHGIVIIGGFCELDPFGRARNSAAIVCPGTQVTVYRKTHLWDREQLTFTAGEQAPPVADTPFGRVGVAICYDAFFPEVMRGLAVAGAELIAVPMNSPLTGAPTEPLAVEIVLALAAANVNRVIVAQADRCGPERGIDWAGATVICDPDGRLAAGPLPDRTRTGLLTARLSLADARDKRIGLRNDVIADRRLDLYASPTPTLKTRENVT
jgi:predicted amidohydrolase